jgi:Cft2 family RNA processing exonuclease
LQLLSPAYLQTDAGAKVIGIYHNSLLPDVLDLSVIPLDLKQTVQVDKDLVIRAYYAGHVCSLYHFLIIP